MRGSNAVDWNLIRSKHRQVEGVQIYLDALSLVVQEQGVDKVESVGYYDVGCSTIVVKIDFSECVRQGIKNGIIVFLLTDEALIEEIDLVDVALKEIVEIGAARCV